MVPCPEPPAKENYLPIVCLKSSITIHIFGKTPSHNALICKTRLSVVLLNESASTEQNPEGRLFFQPFSTTDTSRPAPSLYRHGPPVPAGGGLWSVQVSGLRNFGGGDAGHAERAPQLRAACTLVREELGAGGRRPCWLLVRQTPRDVTDAQFVETVASQCGQMAASQCPVRYARGLPNVNTVLFEAPWLSPP